MPKVEIYSSAYCPFCSAARRLLDAKGVEYTLYSVDGEPDVRAQMTSRAGRHTVPQIFVDGHHVGGFDDLAALEAEARLDPLLGRAGEGAHGP